MGLWGVPGGPPSRALSPPSIRDSPWLALGVPWAAPLLLAGWGSRCLLWGEIPGEQEIKGGGHAPFECWESCATMAGVSTFHPAVASPARCYCCSSFLLLRLQVIRSFRSSSSSTSGASSASLPPSQPPPLAGDPYRVLVVGDPPCPPTQQQQQQPRMGKALCKGISLFQSPPFCLQPVPE